MLTNFSKGSIIYIWSGPESASECNIMKSHKKVAGEALGKWTFLQRNMLRV